MGQGQSGGLPSKQGGIGDRKGDANNKKEKKYEPAAPPTRVGKKQRKQKGPEVAKDRKREIERWREERVGGVFVYLFIWGAMALLSLCQGMH
jgi:hypothetical protein